MNETTFADFGIVTRKSSGHEKVPCPQCQHERRKHPNDRPLSVDHDLGAFYCHHCSFTGGLGGKVWVSPEARRTEYKRPILPPVTNLTPMATLFLESRGIDPDIAERAGVYWDEDERGLAFPYTRDGEIIHIKYRSIRDKAFWSTEGTERTVYGYDQCLGAETVILVEGELDRLAFLTAGTDTVCSVPDGAPNAGQEVGRKLAWMERCAPIFDPAKRIILAVDGDANGTYLADEVARRVGREKVWRVTWPEGCKDANDVLQQYGATALQSIIDNAFPEPIEGIHDGYTLQAKMLQRYHGGRDRGAGFGYDNFDRIYSVAPGFLTIVTGHSGVGKSTVFDQFLVRLAQRNDWHFAIFSPEMQPVERHQESLLTQHLGLPFHDGPTRRMTEAEMLSGNAWLAEHFSYVDPESVTIESILELFRVEIFRRGTRGVVVDPWNELVHNRPPHMSETEFVAVALGAFRRFAQRHNVHFWLIAHPKKLPRTEDGKEKVPHLDEISGSINFRNRADFGLTIHRDIGNPGSPVEVSVSKVKWDNYAEYGTVHFSYDKPTRRLTEIGTVMWDGSVRDLGPEEPF